MTTIKNQIKLIGMLALIMLTSVNFAQEVKSETNTTFRKGFIFEIGIGGGIISLEDSEGTQTFDKSQGAFSFPDLKLGHMLNDNLAIAVVMPGMIYENNDYDRHFGAVLPSLQYWVKDRWWILGGAGLAIDSPALYDIKDNNDDWNLGCAVMASTGYEFYKKNNFALNIQSNLVMGRAFLDNDIKRDAVTFNVGIGISWL